MHPSWYWTAKTLCEVLFLLERHSRPENRSAEDVYLNKEGAKLREGLITIA